MVLHYIWECFSEATNQKGNLSHRKGGFGITFCLSLTDTWMGDRWIRTDEILGKEGRETPSVFALFLNAFVWFAVSYSLSTFHCDCGSLCSVFAAFSYSKSNKWILWSLWCSLCTLNSYHLICDTHMGCFVMYTELYTQLLRGEMILRVATKNHIQPENRIIFLYKMHQSRVYKGSSLFSVIILLS